MESAARVSCITDAAFDLEKLLYICHFVCSESSWLHQFRLPLSHANLAESSLKFSIRIHCSYSPALTNYSHTYTHCAHTLITNNIWSTHFLSSVSRHFSTSPPHSVRQLSSPLTARLNLFNRCFRNVSLTIWIALSHLTSYASFSAFRDKFSSDYLHLWIGCNCVYELAAYVKPTLLLRTL